jgi:hypothetical protein
MDFKIVFMAESLTNEAKGQLYLYLDTLVEDECDAGREECTLIFSLRPETMTMSSTYCNKNF